MPGPRGQVHTGGPLDPAATAGLYATEAGEVKSFAERPARCSGPALLL
jgi:hypothetical protein